MVMDVLPFISKHVAADPALRGHTLEASLSSGSDGFADCLWTIARIFNLIGQETMQNKSTWAETELRPFLVLRGHSETPPTPSTPTSPSSQHHPPEIWKYKK